jgi:predicted nucleotidyltransferase
MSLLDTRLEEVLSQFPGVELAVLFGSHARGEERAGSDVDVAIRLADDCHEARRRVELALGRAAGRDVDVVPLDASPPLLRFEIAREGKVLIERNPQAWADFRARAMLDWWDWAPTARMIHAAAIARLRESVGRGPS